MICEYTFTWNIYHRVGQEILLHCFKVRVYLGGSSKPFLLYIGFVGVNINS